MPRPRLEAPDGSACLFLDCARQFDLPKLLPRPVIKLGAGNFVAGMQWLESTVANRFNRFRREHGHIFQSRYKSLLVDEGDALGTVCDYLHLNPVRAGIVDPATLLTYRQSS